MKSGAIFNIGPWLCFLFLIIILCLLPCPVRGAIYTFVDDNGINRFTNIVPTDRPFRVVMPDRIANWTREKPAMPKVAKRQKLNPAQIFKINSGSVYTVITGASENELKEGKVIVGSAVAISSRHLITNCHLFEQHPFVLIKQANIVDRATVIHSDPYTDRCFIQSEKIKLAPVHGMRTHVSLTVGERVYSIGAPKGIENTFTEGLISGLRKIGKIQYVQTSAPISQGSSGGGLFDEGGSLIGVTTFTLIESQNMNFAISAEDFWR